ncbi:MBL fold metallo-hydrolase [Streptomyces sp. NPDC048281]|uniref:MBL fold metallo-hydrolase n=1 Tax=Streptomyces sp. NPDC048281 TaxID=3154715 RepID=UPI00341AC640
MTTALSRQDCAITVLGGPTAVIDIGGLRVVSDPTFDPAGPQGYLTKTAGPAVDEDGVGPVDLVLVSHEAHPDNLDERGRAFAKTAPLVLTGPVAAQRLGAPAVGLSPWTGHLLPRPDGGGDLTVLAVPAVHGPEDAERDADGNVNCEVTGFVLSGQGLPTVYISGDNASLRTIAEISRRIQAIDVAVLHAGAARVPAKFEGRPLSLTARGAAAAAAVLGAHTVVPAHYDGWAHFSEGRPETELAFHEAGLSALLRVAPHGTWMPLAS